MQTTEPKENEKYMSGGGFHVVKGKTTYEVSLFFNKNSKVTLEEKLKQLIRQDVKNENF